MWVNAHFYLVYSHLLNKFLKEKFIFLHWFVQVNRQKTAVKKKITYFLKSYVASLSTFFEKVFAISKFFTALCLDVRCWDFLYFICLSSVHSIGIFLFARRKCVELVNVFNKREETFAVSLLNRKSCVCRKYLTLFRPRKLISESFAFLYSM